MGNGCEWTFLQRRCTNVQKEHEKKFHITAHQGNANQMYRTAFNNIQITVY